MWQFRIETRRPTATTDSAANRNSLQCTAYDGRVEADLPGEEMTRRTSAWNVCVALAHIDLSGDRNRAGGAAGHGIGVLIVDRRRSPDTPTFNPLALAA